MDGCASSPDCLKQVPESIDTWQKEEKVEYSWEAENETGFYIRVAICLLLLLYALTAEGGERLTFLNFAL